DRRRARGRGPRGGARVRAPGNRGPGRGRGGALAGGRAFVTRHTDFSTTPRRPPLGTGAIVLLAAAALAAAAAGVAAGSARRDVDAARGRLAAVQRETDQLRARTRAFEARGLRGRDVVGARAWLTSAAPPPRLLAEMGELLPPDVRLEGVTLRYGSRLD